MLLNAAMNVSNNESIPSIPVYKKISNSRFFENNITINFKPIF